MAETLRNRLIGSAVHQRHESGELRSSDTLSRLPGRAWIRLNSQSSNKRNANYAPQLHRYNEYNRRVFQIIHAEAIRGDGVVLSMTDRFRETDYGQPVVALKSYIMSPFSDQQYVQAVIDSIERARRQVE